MAYVTRARILQSLPRLASLATAELDALADEATGMIDDYCRRPFGPGPFAETHDADASGVVFLRSTPVASITSVTTGLPDAPTVLASTAYRFDALTGELRLGGSGVGFWPSGVDYHWLGGDAWQSVRVVYAGPATVPPAVVRVCLNLVSRLASGSAIDAGIRSKTMGQVSVTYADSSGVTGVMAAADMLALSKYRRLSL